MKRFLFLPTIILAILFGCSEVNENIDTNSGHYENSGNNAANIISKLSPGIYTINVFGEINPVTISNIKAAMINNPKAKISLDLSNTTGLLGIESEAFMGCDNLINITIPNNIDYIGNHAFSSCNNLINITIPDSVTLIQSNAFNSCNSLTSIIIPNGVTHIGYNAFSYCQNLTNITIPNSVTSIGYNAFSYCTSLTNISIPDSITSIEYSTFSYCTNLTSVTIGSGLSSFYLSMFNGCTNLTTLTVSDSNSYLKSNGNCIYNKDGTTLYLCANGLTEVTILDSTITICDDAFYNCDNLTSVTIPDSVTSIGKSAFGYCNKLTNITFADTTSTWYYTSRSDYTDGTAIDVTDAATNATNLTETYYNKYWYKEASSIE